MASYVSHTTIDCANPYELATWWKQVLGYVDLDDDPNEPGHEECVIRHPETGHLLLFIRVPDTKTVKNRIHLDLRPVEGSRDDELARLLSSEPALSGLVLGGDRALLSAVLDDPRLRPVAALPRVELPDVPEPRRATLVEVARRYREVRIRLTEPGD